MSAANHYRRILVPANESPDGESPTLIEVVDFDGIYALVYHSHDIGTVMLASGLQRDPLIRQAVVLPAESIEAAAKAIDAQSRALLITQHLEPRP